MRLEYLMKTEEDADKCLTVSTEAKKTKIGENCYLISIYKKSESEDSARKLSDINDAIIASVNPIVLSNGAAEYYNKRLYPTVNTFERKLRKLLYAASVLNSSETDKINDLEGMDFGELFGLLFRDDQYYNQVKIYINKKWTGYSSELLKQLKSEKENLLWDRLLSGQVPTLRSSFEEVRTRRNDVMHARNIGKSDYNRTSRLFEDIINEIDAAIEKLANGALIPDDFNKIIENYLTTENGEYITDEKGNRLLIE